MWEGDTIDRILGFVTCRGGTGSCRNKGGGKKGLHLTYKRPLVLACLGLGVSQNMGLSV
jgi:hypothetical protein